MIGVSTQGLPQTTKITVGGSTIKGSGTGSSVHETGNTGTGNKGTGSGNASSVAPLQTTASSGGSGP